MSDLFVSFFVDDSLSTISLLLSMKAPFNEGKIVRSVENFVNRHKLLKTSQITLLCPDS